MLRIMPAALLSVDFTLASQLKRIHTRIATAAAQVRKEGMQTASLSVGLRLWQSTQQTQSNNCNIVLPLDKLGHAL